MILTATYLMQTARGSWQQPSPRMFLQALVDWTTATCQGFPWRMDVFQLWWFWQRSAFCMDSSIVLFKTHAKDAKTIRALNGPQCKVKPFYCRHRISDVERKGLLAACLDTVQWRTLQRLMLSNAGFCQLLEQQGVVANGWSHKSDVQVVVDKHIPVLEMATELQLETQDNCVSENRRLSICERARHRPETHTHSKVVKHTK